ncbi:MAG: hypothetical protein OXM62_03040 [bacterium]|nr:hypothetical protein [bacterium]
MDRPDFSGVVLRAIAKSYRDEMGPARAEQLASRAIARAGERSRRHQRIGVLASSVALAVSLVVAGVAVLTGGSDSLSPLDSESATVASGTAVGDGVNVPTLTREGLMEALDLIDQQQELEAAEMVVTALSYIADSIASADVDPSEDTIKDLAPPAPPPEGAQTPNTSASVSGTPSPEEDMHAAGPQPSGQEESSGGPVYETSELHPGEPVAEVGSPVNVTADPAVIEELGQMLKIEVEELLGVLDIPESDPDAINEAVEEVEKAVAPILEYHSQDEPTILVPTSGDDEEE